MRSNLLNTSNEAAEEDERAQKKILQRYEAARSFQKNASAAQGLYS